MKNSLKSFHEVQAAIAKRYRELTTRQLELNMGEKSWLDKMFDVADEALGGVEKTLKQEEPNKKSDIIDAEFRTVDEKGKVAWDSRSWAWCVSDSGATAFHLMEEANTTAVGCKETFQSHNIERKLLERDKRVVVCTSCLMAMGHG